MRNIGELKVLKNFIKKKKECRVVAIFEVGCDCPSIYKRYGIYYKVCVVRGFFFFSFFFKIKIKKERERKERKKKPKWILKPKRDRCLR